MAIQTNSLGPNSAYVVYTVGETNATIIAAVYAWVQSHGWELHDNASSASSKVFKALCGDMSTYKYMMIGYDSNGIYMRVFEGWNAGTHAGTNETWYSGQSAIRYQRTDVANGGYVYMFATQRYCVLFSRTLGGAWGDSGLQSWSGCFEISEDGRDGRGLPIFGWTNGYSMMGGQIPIDRWGAINGGWNTTVQGTAAAAINNWVATTGTVYGCFSFPRLTTGGTGVNAEKFVTTGCALGLTTVAPYTMKMYMDYTTPGMYWGSGSWGNSINAGMVKPDGTTEITLGGENGTIYNNYYTYKTFGAGTKLIDLVPTTNNAVTSTPWALTPWVYEMNSSNYTKVVEPRGKVFGIKLLQQSLGNFMDTITIAVNDKGFMEIGGADMTHHIITAGPGMTTARFAIPA